jgi:hypothetical protein
VGLVISGADLDIGGNGYAYSTSAVDVIGGDCAIPNIPFPRIGSFSFSTADLENPRLMVCGGKNTNLDDVITTICHQYEPTADPPAWTLHSHLRSARQYASAVTLAAGTYVLGGSWQNGSDFGTVEAWSTSEILRPVSNTWEEGPTLPGGVGLSDSCAVAINSTTFLLIGGARYNGINIDNSINISRSSSVHEFSSLTGTWTQWTAALKVPRSHHACSTFNGTVVFAGGTGSGIWNSLASTEVLDLVSRKVRTAGPMATKRWLFGMYEIGYAGSRILLTLGTLGPNPQITPTTAEKESLLQEWDPATEVWKPAPAVMARRYGFAAVSVDARHVCPRGELLACSNDSQ